MSSHEGLEPCQHLSLARSEIGGISSCRACGVVQLHLQALSQRLAAMAQPAGEPPRPGAPGQARGLH